MDPVTASMIASAGISLGKGAHQAYKAHKLSKEKRPTYQTPKGIKEAGNIYRKRAAGLALPGESMLREEIQGQQSSLIEKGKGAGDPTGYLQTLASATESGMDAERQMRFKAIERKDQATKDLADFNKIEADYQDKEWDINKNQPYQEKMAAARGLKEASWKNIEGGLNKGIGAGVSASGGGANTGLSGGGSAVSGSEGTAGGGTIGSPQPTSTGMSMPSSPTVASPGLSKYPQSSVMKLKSQGYDDAAIERILSGKISG